jgi:hypothetical protein
MSKLFDAILLAAAAALFAGTILAQSAPAPVPDRPPTTLLPQDRVPERLAPSDTLSGADRPLPGVISPRGNPDRGISVVPPAPDPGTTRVIPPPGTPGGDPRVQPR